MTANTAPPGDERPAARADWMMVAVPLVALAVALVALAAGRLVLWADLERHARFVP